MSYPNPNYPSGHPYNNQYQHSNPLASQPPPLGFPPHQPYPYQSPTGAYDSFSPSGQPAYPDPRLQGYPSYPYNPTPGVAPGNFAPHSPGQGPPPDQRSPYGQYSHFASHSPVPPHLPPHVSPNPAFAPSVDPGLYQTSSPYSQAGPTHSPVNPLAAVPATETSPVPQPAPPKVTLRIPRPAAAPAPATVNPSDLNMSRHNPSRVAIIATESYSSSGRPTRRSAVQAQAQLSQIHDDLPSDQDGEGEEDDDDDHPVQSAFTRSGRSSKPPKRYSGGDDDFEVKPGDMSPPPVARRASGRARGRIFDPDDEEDEATQEDEVIEKAPPRNAFPSARLTRSALHSASAPEIGQPGPSFSNGAENVRNGRRGGRPPPRNREKTKSRHSSADGDSFNPDESDGTPATNSDLESDDPLEEPYAEHDDDDENSFISHSPGSRRRRGRPARASTRASTRRATRTTRASARRQDSDEEYGGRRNLRERKQVNYELPPLDISTEITAGVMQDAINAASRPGGRASGPRGFAGGSRLIGAAGKSMPWSLKGRDFSQAMGDPDTSDSDDMLTPMKPAGGQQGATGPRVSAPTDVPNFGRINPKSNTADADPLGVDMNVTFENVGGLDGHINQLKEMVALPLLYPELFQQFGITPPRGVLFHGPPGTGKTLLARALAASCSSGNTKIAFFMRKGADVLSKWVGEAERQLRMLFEEARAAQPSIIFFDEIDGLAPVRSSKQDQIHASLVSTLLALMDGMDGRGQVIVIGATNRPDSVDPALRRPGRFDREFYFPLPNKDARRRIIEINTRKWDPPLASDVLERLAVLTKGYGGADLRALCTEAALNAIQRRYPQIYKSTDRFSLDPKSIAVSTKDFMMSVQKIVPSSARSTSSSAAQLPGHLVPLLREPLARLKAAVDNVLPRHKTLTALEEAAFEDEGDDYEKAILLQSLDKLRTYRPRVLVSGPSGMGQTYLGSAILHHLEGFHVQSFDLGVLLGDSGRTVEAALVQLFIEAKRHQPSIIYIPSLATWSSTLTDSAKSTFQALLDSVPPSDPVLVLGVADGEVTWDVRGWFGYGSEEGEVQLTSPAAAERETYFAPLLELVRRPPVEFPDAIPRKLRVLETLPLAAPLPPRELTEAEIQRESARDSNARTMMVISFITFVGELLKKYRKVVATVRMDAMELSQILAAQAAAAAAPVEDTAALAASEAVETATIIPNGLSDANGIANLEAGAAPTGTLEAAPLGPAPSPPIVSADAPLAGLPVAIDEPSANEVPRPAPVWQAHDIDIDTLQRKVVKHKYLTPSDFLADIALIEENAAKLGDLERIGRIAEMAAQARFHVSGFDPKWTPEFEAYKERVLKRREERAQQKAKAGTAGTIAPPEKGAVAQAEAEGMASHEDGTDYVDLGVNGKRARDEDGDVDMDMDGSEPKRARAEGAADILDAPSEDPNGSTSALPSDNTAPPSLPAPVEYPPFILSHQDVSSLADRLVADTDHFTVEELEQLRTGMYDRIWKSRSHWDRTGVVKDLGEYLGGYVKRVRQRADERAREEES